MIEGESAGFGDLVDRRAVRARGGARDRLRAGSSGAGPTRCSRSSSFAIPTFAIANGVAFATSFGLFAVFFFTSLYLQVVSHFSGWKIALQFLAMAVAIAVGGRRGRRLDRARAAREDRWLSAACSPASGCSPSTTLLKPSVSVAPLAAALAVAGLGLGLALVAVTAAVLSIVPAERSGMAASTVNTSRQLGGVLAVAILGAVVNARLVGDARHAPDEPRACPRASSRSSFTPSRRRPSGECDRRGSRKPRRRDRRCDPSRHPRQGARRCGGLDGKRGSRRAARCRRDPARRRRGLARRRQDQRAVSPATSNGGVRKREGSAPPSSSRLTDAAMRSTACSSSADEVPKLSRAKPLPCSPNARARR